MGSSIAERTGDTPNERPTTATSGTSVISSGGPPDSLGSVSSTKLFRRVANVDNVNQVFLFVNPTSGGNAASAFTAAGLTQALLTNPDVEVHVADIRDGSSGQKPGFQLLKRYTDEATRKKRRGEPAESIVVVMCGGDGTVLWGIMEMWEHGIASDDIVVTVIPYGTGNDFAKSLGWETLNAMNPFQNEMTKFKALIREWLSCPAVYHDVWDLTVELYPGGQFHKIDSKTRSKVVLQEEGKDALRLNKKLNNYFSVGVESRIGIGFDRHRKNTSLKNKIVYMNEGVKKALLHRRINLLHVLDYLMSNDQVVFTTDKKEKEHKHLRGCSSLIAVNIPSFAAGLNIWKNARRSGLYSSVRDTETDSHLMSLPQLMGDGKIEWVSFGGVAALGTEQVIEGFGRRIHQGEGPFHLEFNSSLPDKERVYFQVDGEYFHMTKPKELRIKLFRKVKCLARQNARSVKFIE